ncbi:Fe-S-containing protein [Oleidesulfovibrio sp.]|uniref:Fe-S-containing protein n=1 Tax=Oleidesulfovibrio sp. TaxID=2909707 RepID=UPI003A8A0CD6
MRRVITTIAALVLVSIVPLTAKAFFGFGKYTDVTPKDNIISIPVSDVSDGDAHFFSMESKGREIRFFILKSDDGTLRAAFDACDVCFRERKGYEQEGEWMKCVNCGQKFHSSRINVVSGGCNPAPLKREVQGDVLVIRAYDVLQGARFF